MHTQRQKKREAGVEGRVRKYVGCVCSSLNGSGEGHKNLMKIRQAAFIKMHTTLQKYTKARIENEAF
jgi:hypothetical protein